MPSVIRIRSRTNPKVVYTVKDGACNCWAGKFKRRCWHIGAVESMKALGLVSAEIGA